MSAVRLARSSAANVIRVAFSSVRFVKSGTATPFDHVNPYRFVSNRVGIVQPAMFVIASTFCSYSRNSVPSSVIWVPSSPSPLTSISSAKPRFVISRDETNVFASVRYSIAYSPSFSGALQRQFSSGGETHPCIIQEAIRRMRHWAIDRHSFQHLSSPTKSKITQRSAGHFPGVLDLYRVLTRRPMVHLHLPPAVTLHKRNDTLHRTPSVCLERFRRNTRFDQIRWQLCRAESIRNESCQSTEQPKSRRPTPLHYRILRRSARKLKAL